MPISRMSRKPCGRDQAEPRAAALDHRVGDQRRAVHDLADIGRASMPACATSSLEAVERGRRTGRAAWSGACAAGRAPSAVIEDEVGEGAADVEADTKACPSSRSRSRRPSSSGGMTNTPPPTIAGDQHGGGLPRRESRGRARAAARLNPRSASRPSNTCWTCPRSSERWTAWCRPRSLTSWRRKIATASSEHHRRAIVHILAAQDPTPALASMPSKPCLLLRARARRSSSRRVTRVAGV